MLETYLLQHGTVVSIIHIIKSDSQLKLCHARLEPGGDGEKPVLAGVEIIALGPLDDYQAWDVFTGTPSYILLWKKSGMTLIRIDCPMSIYISLTSYKPSQKTKPSKVSTYCI